MDRINGIRANDAAPVQSKAKTKPSARGENQQSVKDGFEKSSSDNVNWDKIPESSRRYFSTGNKVTPLMDGSISKGDSASDIFKNIEDLVRGAKKSIQIEMFSLDKKDLVDLLIQDAKNGVKVQIIMDPPNELPMEAEKGKAIEKLRKNGVDVLLYPVKEANSPESKFGQIDHVKMMIVDGNKAIIGGMNWGQHSPNNRDVDVMVEGPAVDNMEWMFRKDWLTSGGEQKDLPWIDKTPAHPEGNSAVQLINSSLDRNDQTIGMSVNRAIRNAKKSIHCELFCLSQRETVENLIDAHKRGLDVRILLNPLKIKDFAVNEKAAAQLKDAGVPVRWYVPDKATENKLHAKIGVFDDDQVILGSANWTNAGFKVNREADVEVLDKKVNSAFDKAFEIDWAKGSEEPHYLENHIDDPGG
ncbi:MAG: phosphatidylserine/phosphatidylglycerophosphate/cardiolipin synthase family protein [Firmicutes bacterium]|nr:phosphatidylserine/phosphatidylglycerophosphate/cardiolipin synthase family protein [Bacillota bacterium]